HEGAVVMARQRNVLVTSFHPELTSDTRIHRYFVEMVKEYEKKEVAR
ncbi:TPA: pyridoxal 5'-phosphate synthase glutaminase subunit PdxT, partial [Candidatus Acetothermia bacterium]|nr:pyridoxal 5'-phosphate synthase glutaminase subunit PdxT [Candidatus Acetothermia bacterium]